MTTNPDTWWLFVVFVAYAAGMISGMRLGGALRPKRRKVPRWVADVFEREAAR